MGRRAGPPFSLFSSLIMRALVLLTFVFWRVAELTVAMAAGASSLHWLKASTSIKASYIPMLLPCLFPEYVGGVVPSPTKPSQGTSTIRNSFPNIGNPDLLQVSGDLVPLCTFTCAMVMGLSPRKGDEANDELGKGNSKICVAARGPEAREVVGCGCGSHGHGRGDRRRSGIARMMPIEIGPHASIYHIGKPPRRLHGGERCHAIAGGHECHRYGDGENTALLPRNLNILQVAATGHEMARRLIDDMHEAATELAIVSTCERPRTSAMLWGPLLRRVVHAPICLGRRVWWPSCTRGPPQKFPSWVRACASGGPPCSNFNNRVTPSELWGPPIQCIRNAARDDVLTSTRTVSCSSCRVGRAQQPHVLMAPTSIRQLLLWRWSDDSVSLWVFGSSFFYLRRQQQQHSSVVGMCLLRRLHRPAINRRFVRSVHPGARVFDASANTPHRQDHPPRVLVDAAVFSFGHRT